MPDAWDAPGRQVDAERRRAVQSIDLTYPIRVSEFFSLRGIQSHEH